MKKLHLLLVLCWLPFAALAQDDSSLSVERLWQLERIGQPARALGFGGERGRVCNQCRCRPGIGIPPQTFQPLRDGEASGIAAAVDARKLRRLRKRTGRDTSG